MSVASVDSSLERAFDSQINNQVEISAPGVSIRSTYPINTYERESGTSMASPHVAGVAALLWMYFPKCTNQQIRNSMLRTVKPLSNGCDEKYGHGLVQAIKAFEILMEADCGGYADITYAKGGCEQAEAHSWSCNVNSDCVEGDACTDDYCSSFGTCELLMDCARCGRDGLLSIDIMTDLFPGETTWNVNQGTTTYASGGPYPEMTMYSTKVCLSAGIYTFNIFDSFGDGIEGEGGYTLTLDDNVLKVGRILGSSESFDFFVAPAK